MSSQNRTDDAMASRLKLVVQLHIALIYLHNTNVVIVQFVAFSIIDAALIAYLNTSAVLRVCKDRLPLVLTTFGYVGQNTRSS